MNGKYDFKENPKSDLDLDLGFVKSFNRLNFEDFCRESRIASFSTNYKGKIWNISQNLLSFRTGCTDFALTCLKSFVIE